MATSIVSGAKSKADKASLAANLAKGTSKHFPDASQVLSFGGAMHTVTALTQLFQSFVDLRQAVIASQAATKAKVATERAQAPSLLVIIDEFVAFVKVTFGNQPTFSRTSASRPPRRGRRRPRNRRPPPPSESPLARRGTRWARTRKRE